MRGREQMIRMHVYDMLWLKTPMLMDSRLTFSEFVYKFIHNILPNLFTNYYQKINELHKHETTNAMKLHVKKQEHVEAKKRQHFKVLKYLMDYQRILQTVYSWKASENH